MGEEEGMNQDTEGKRDWECRIGFERKGRPGVLDIEVCFFPHTLDLGSSSVENKADLQECPIATPVINSKMIEERQRVKE
jgi:tRNA (uracil-5-)-methyltransferase